MKMDSDVTFIRTIEFFPSVSMHSTSLTVHQKYVGDVGCVVWDAALVLLKYLFTETGSKYIKGKTVLELGSGTGVVGLASIIGGASNAVLTDLPEYLSLIELNINENKNVLHAKPTITTTTPFSSNTVRAQTLHWGSKEDLDRIYDNGHDTFLNIECVLIADCIYYEEGVLKLYETIVMIMERTKVDTKILCSYEIRDTGNKLLLLKKFIKLLSSNASLEISYVQKKDMDEEYRCDDISIMIIGRAV